MKKILKRKKFWLLLILAILLAVGFWNIWKPLPNGLNLKGETYLVPEESVHFLADLTYLENGERKVEQEIFDEVFSMIKNAHSYILIDMFLFNEFQGTTVEDTRALTSELTETLIQKKQSDPHVQITFISDPINAIYGAGQPKEFAALSEVGINVVVTDLTKLRDSNPIYSALWRTILRWIPPITSVSNPFDSREDKIKTKNLLSLLNFKANHRKIIVADYFDGDETKMSTLVTSANPHDGSSAHGNIAIKIDDHIWKDVLKSEKAVANFSDKNFTEPYQNYDDKEGEVEVTLITELQIRKAIIESLDRAEEGDKIFASLFYLSDRKVIKAMKDALERGVEMQLILDPNKDAFGREKNGVPNRPVAAELLKEGKVQIRWCDTHGEQCHAKILIVQTSEKTDLILGSANFTKRNIGNYNLETNVLVSGSSEIEAISDASEYFEKIWTNASGKIYTADYEKYKDESFWKTALYRVMEKTGMSSF